MKITFTDGTTKGLKDEGVTARKVENGCLVLQMKDGAEFQYPLTSIREIKIGGSRDDEAPAPPQKGQKSV